MCRVKGTNCFWFNDWFFICNQACIEITNYFTSEKYRNIFLPFPKDNTCDLYVFKPICVYPVKYFVRSLTCQFLPMLFHGVNLWLNSYKTSKKQ